MKSPSSAAARSDLFLYMTKSHDYLRKVLTCVLAALESNDRDTIGKIWTELDQGLRAHMETEERYVLPMFAHVDGDEARALLREHGLIRDELLQLGIAVDLHFIRYDRSREFVALLEAHAGREENLLYRWADEELEASRTPKGSATDARTAVSTSA